MTNTTSRPGIPEVAAAIRSSTTPVDATTGGAARLERMNGAVLPDLDKVREALAAPVDPHPKNRRITTELTPRDHVLPVPNGWYGLLRSDELAAGDVVSLQAVGRDLVAYRDDEGAAHVLDPYCPHMGAHLGGGTVVGDNLQCPYHGWQYAGDGRCVEIAYAEGRIPAKARVVSYEVREHDGFVFLWYHAAGTPPTYEPPRIVEHEDPDWSDPHVFETDLVAALQEMAENNIDFAHFKYVHGREVVPKGVSEHIFDGPLATVEENLGDGMSFLRLSFGPGIAVLRFTGLMTIVACTTPIDRGNVRLKWHFYFTREMEVAAPDLIDSVVGPYGLQADIPIWRDMKYLERPVLVKGDGPFMEHRRWYNQFYEGN